MTAVVERLAPVDILAVLPALRAILQDAVAHGASIGWTQTPDDDEAAAYWDDVRRKVADGGQWLWIARAGDQVAGTVQLALAARQNGSHRAEVQKLLVHTAFRRRGVGDALMRALEAEARALGRTLLVLDTVGAGADVLYSKLGFQTAGIIPQFARSTEGVLEATIVMYKVLE